MLRSDQMFVSMTAEQLFHISPWMKQEQTGFTPGAWGSAHFGNVEAEVSTRKPKPRSLNVWRKQDRIFLLGILTSDWSFKKMFIFWLFLWNLTLNTIITIYHKYFSSVFVFSHVTLIFKSSDKDPTSKQCEVNNTQQADLHQECLFVSCDIMTFFFLNEHLNNSWRKEEKTLPEKKTKVKKKWNLRSAWCSCGVTFDPIGTTRRLPPYRHGSRSDCKTTLDTGGSSSGLLSDQPVTVTIYGHHNHSPCWYGGFGVTFSPFVFLILNSVNCRTE